MRENDKGRWAREAKDKGEGWQMEGLKERRKKGGRKKRAVAAYGCGGGKGGMNFISQRDCLFREHNAH